MIGKNSVGGLFTGTTPLVERLRRLSRVRVVCTSVNLELGQHLPANFVFWKHATNCITHDLFRLPLHSVPDRFAPQARITGIPGVATLLPLITGMDDLVAIGHDHEIASIFIRSISWFVLTH